MKKLFHIAVATAVVAFVSLPDVVLAQTPNSGHGDHSARGNNRTGGVHSACSDNRTRSDEHASGNHNACGDHNGSGYHTRDDHDGEGGSEEKEASENDPAAGDRQIGRQRHSARALSQFDSEGISPVHSVREVAIRDTSVSISNEAVE